MNKGYKNYITCAKDVYDMFVDELKDLKQEHFIVVCLDSKNKVIRSEVVFVGTLNSILVHPREVFKVAIKESANSIILVHNHPTGDCSPSKEDVEITKKIKEIGELVGIMVQDHIIICKHNWISI